MPYPNITIEETTACLQQTFE